MRESSNVLIVGISDKMAIHFNVFGMQMKDRIGCNLYVTCVICMERGNMRFEAWGKTSLESSPIIERISEQVEEMAWYLVSVKHLKTLSCLLHFDEINESLRYMHHSVVEQYVSGHPSQFVLE